MVQDSAVVTGTAQKITNTHKIKKREVRGKKTKKCSQRENGEPVCRCSGFHVLAPKTVCTNGAFARVGVCSALEFNCSPRSGHLLTGSFAGALSI